MALRRWTYEELLSYWNSPQAISPEFGPMLNSAPKYVASTTLQEPLPWPNSTRCTVRSIAQ